MTQKMIVAAMRAWNGQKVNWTQIMQQKMLEEIAEKRVMKTKMMELYSTSYISVLCEELPPPSMFVGGPSSLSITSSPSPSLKKPSEEAMENQRLKTQLQALQTIADKRQEHLIEKDDALVQCQTSNVKNFYELAQALKEKMEMCVGMEALKKTVEASQAQMEAQDKENQTLKLQLQAQEQYQMELAKCQEELKLAKSESYQLQEKLQLQ